MTFKNKEHEGEKAGTEAGSVQSSSLGMQVKVPKLHL